MNAKTLAIPLFAVTAAVVALVPMLAPVAQGPQNAPPPPIPDRASGAQPRVDAVFVLDTTGSMGGLIQAAKDKIWSIASTLANAQPRPQLRIGLVAYRDRGDDYVTRVVDLSTDLDSIHAALAQLQAQGGGDGPEDVNQALADALAKVSWTRDPGAYRTVFLVGDAPPHTDYQGETQYPELLAQARQRGIRVNAIQCGDYAETAAQWQRIAQLGDGSYFRVDSQGGAVAIATPFDAGLAKLGSELDETRIYYGTQAERTQRSAELAESKADKAAAPAPALARRAGFVASEGGSASLLGKQELVEGVQSGKVDLAKLPPEQLPAKMAALDLEARRKLVEETASNRARLRDEIQQLSARRDAWLKDKVEAAGGAKKSLDRQLYDTVKTQAADLGLRYESDAPAY